MAEVNSTFQLTPGDSAPDFTLPDAQGIAHTLGDLVGNKGTLVIFSCNHCPFVVHLAKAIASFSKEISELGIATIAINSNDVENYPADSPDKMLEFSKQYGWDFPYLYDEDQSVAKDYCAACTPDFYLFDAHQTLFYAGQFDASRPKNEAPVTGVDLRRATEALIHAHPAPTPQLPSSGCNIKWKTGNAPPYFG